MPARISNRQKQLRGTLRPGRVNKRAPRLTSVAVPPPPRDLPPAERSVWGRLAREIPPGVFTGSDVTSFGLFVHAVALAEDPPADMTDSAKIHWHRVAAFWLGRFGCDPLARERVTSLAPTEDAARADAIAEFNQDGSLRVVR